MHFGKESVPMPDGRAHGCVRSWVMKSELLKSRKMSLRLWHCRELFSAIQLASLKAHRRAFSNKNNTFDHKTQFFGLKKSVVFFYSGSTPVEFGEDTST